MMRVPEDACAWLGQLRLSKSNKAMGEKTVFWQKKNGRSDERVVHASASVVSHTKEESEAVIDSQGGTDRKLT